MEELLQSEGAAAMGTAVLIGFVVVGAGAGAIAGVGLGAAEGADTGKIWVQEVAARDDIQAGNAAVSELQQMRPQTPETAASIAAIRKAIGAQYQHLDALRAEAQALAARHPSQASEYAPWGALYGAGSVAGLMVVGTLCFGVQSWRKSRQEKRRKVDGGQ